ncbi:hypothetical protein RB595_005750 [Gaeumannomyces hyphopodioides]
MGDPTDDRRDGEILLTPRDIVIAVMGITGSGKSTFINLFNDSAVIGDNLQSETADVQIFPATIKGQKIYLVDTPGFDDTHKSDVDVLRLLVNWLGETYKREVRLAGIVYLHRIADPRMSGSAMKNLRMFKKLCGNDALSRVVLATTMWGNVSEKEGARREEELRTNEDYWSGMIEEGSEMLRQDKGLVSATRIIEHICSRHRSSRRSVSLEIQREMASGKTLDETSAGLEVEAEMNRLRAKFEEEKKSLRAEFEEAKRDQDEATQREVEKARTDLEAKMKKVDEDRERMRVDMEELQKQREEEIRLHIARMNEAIRREVSAEMQKVHANFEEMQRRHDEDRRRQHEKETETTQREMERVTVKFGAEMKRAQEDREKMRANLEEMQRQRDEEKRRQYEREIENSRIYEQLEAQRKATMDMALRQVDMKHQQEMSSVRGRLVEAEERVQKKGFRGVVAGKVRRYVEAWVE